MNLQGKEKRMKDYDKFIFDLDYTLLIPDWQTEDDYLKKHIPKDIQERFFAKKQGILDSYEATYPKYDLNTLSLYFKEHGFDIPEDLIYGWMIHNGDAIIDKVPECLIDLLEYLKSSGKSLVVLTNWFGATQVPRLKRVGILDYFDYIVTGDMAMKPGKEAFTLAIGDTSIDKCLMIGDSLKSDKKGADDAGIDSYILGNDNSIKTLYELLKENRPLKRIKK